MSLASLQMPLGVPGYQYETDAQMAEALAQCVAEALRQALGERGRACCWSRVGAAPSPCSNAWHASRCPGSRCW